MQGTKSKFQSFQYKTNIVIIMIIIILLTIVILQGFMFRMKGMEVELANGKDTSSFSVGGVMPALLILKPSC